MSIFITGGSGFVGLNLAGLLLARGEHVTLFSASAPLSGAVEELSRLPGRLDVVNGDVTDAKALAVALAASGAKRVIHAAAITAGPERDAREPQRVVAVNLGGTLNMLEAARAAGVTRYVQASTGAVYGAASMTSEPIAEDTHLPSPSTMYGISKYAAERAVLHLGELWGLDVVAGRLAVVFGPWEYQTGLRDRMSALWQLTRIARDGGEAVIPAQGVQDWIYAPDVARSLVALLDAPRLPHRLYHLGRNVRGALRHGRKNSRRGIRLFAIACPRLIPNGRWQRAARSAARRLTPRALGRTSGSNPSSTSIAALRITSTGWSSTRPSGATCRWCPELLSFCSGRDSAARATRP